MSYDNIIAALNNLDFDALVETWNLFVDESNGDYGEDHIYDMDEFDEDMGPIVDGKGPLWLAHRINYGDFTTVDDYYHFNAYGNLYSFSWWNNCDNNPIDIDVMAKYMAETGNNLGIDIDEED